MTAHIFIGPHPDTLGDGTPLAIGQLVPQVNAEDPHDQRLIAKGWLIPEQQQQPSEPAKPRAPRARTDPSEQEVS